MNLDGAVAVVTGGASGLGAATAGALAGRGARVAIVDLDAEAASAVARSLGDGAIGLGADVAGDDELAAALAEVGERLGAPRVAVSCAGVATAQRAVGRDGRPAPLSAFESVVRVNLTGSYNLLRLGAAAMAWQEPAADGERGVVILTASIAAFDGQTGQTAYAASKGGVASLVLPAARELAHLGVRVAAIAPGTFDTPMLASLPDAARERLASQTPFPARPGHPEEFAALACHIAENPMINGATLRLDGAMRMPY